MQEANKRKLMEKLREADNKRLQEAVHSGKVDNAGALVCSTIEKLKEKIRHAEAQHASLRVRYFILHIRYCLPLWYHKRISTRAIYPQHS
jgi:CRISPR/Cas system-associated endoribonuclease Cas2